MADRVEEFRRVAAGKRKLGRRARYGAAMRRFALGHAETRMSAGASMQRVAAELGLTGQTLANWLRTAAKVDERGARLVPIKMKQETREPSRAPIVIIAGVVRIEVGEVAIAAELTRRLQ